MNPKSNIFLTGITGLLGSHLAKELLINGNKIFAIVRSDKNISSWQRTIESLKFVFGNEWDENLVLPKLRVISGDISEPDLGIQDYKTRRLLISEIDIIFHSAALTELTAPLCINRKMNVEGTRNVLEFAMQCRANGGLAKFNHISTIYVAGAKEMRFDETMLDVGQNFNNPYEQSKFEAEKLLEGYSRKGLNVSVFRPSMIAGDSRTGKTNNFRLFYQPLHYFANELFEKFPGNFESSLNLINIDVAARAIVALSERGENSVYHIISPCEIKLRFLIELAADYFGFQKPEFIPIEKFDFDDLTSVQRALASPFMPYLNYKAILAADKTFSILRGSYGFDYPRFNESNLSRIFEYCVMSKFIKKQTDGKPTRR